MRSTVLRPVKLIASAAGVLLKPIMCGGRFTHWRIPFQPQCAGFWPDMAGLETLEILELSWYYRSTSTAVGIYFKFIHFASIEVIDRTIDFYKRRVQT